MLEKGLGAKKSATSPKNESKKCRAREIAAWREQHHQMDNAPWVALDDVNLEEQDPDFMAGHFVRTDDRVGVPGGALVALSYACP